MIGKVVRNTIFLFASQIVARLIGFLYFIFLARVLGVGNFGIYVFTTAFIYNFVPIADFGLERLVLRDISREPGESRYYLSRLVPLRLFLALIAFVLSIVLGLVLGQPFGQILYLAIFGSALVPYNLTLLFASFLNSREKMGYLAGANIALILLTAILGGIFASLGWGMIYILLAYPLANLLLFLYFVFNSQRWEIPWGWVIDWNFWKKSLAQSWMFAFLLIIAVFYLRLTTILVNLIKGSEATGFYSSAFKFVEAMILIPQSLALALFPLSSRLMVESKEKLKKIYWQGLGILLLSSLPFSLILIFGARLIIRFSYGVDYLPAVPAFAVLGIALVFFFINALAGNIIQNSKELRKFLPFTVVNFLVTLLLALVLIPRYSIVGAAWAVVGGEVFGLLINNLFVFKILKS
jgi:O-antigen/teichoic acid export membrane protein